MYRNISHQTTLFSATLIFFIGLFIASPVLAQKNLALGKRAYQSSTSNNAVASRAVDGVTNGFWHNNSVTSTENEAGAWWEVDLGAEYDITKIIIFNRMDSWSDRLRSMEVYLRSADGKTMPFCCPTSDSPSDKIVLHGQPVKARYVRIKLAEANFLSLAEVQVYEVAKNKKETATAKSRTSYQKVRLYASSLN